MPSLLTTGLTIAIVAVLVAAISTSNPQTLETIKRCLDAQAFPQPAPCRLSEDTGEARDDVNVRFSTDHERTATDSGTVADAEVSTL